MNDLKKKQLVRYGNELVPYELVRQFNAFSLVDDPRRFNIKIEKFTVEQFDLKRNIYNASSNLSGGKAIYSLWNKGERVYIGRTNRKDQNPYTRPMEHRTCTRSPKEYDSVIVWILPEEVCSKTLESILIFKYEPILNNPWKQGGTDISKRKLNQLKALYTKLNKIPTV